MAFTRLQERARAKGRALLVALMGALSNLGPCTVHFLMCGYGGGFGIILGVLVTVQRSAWTKHAYRCGCKLR